MISTMVFADSTTDAIMAPINKIIDLGKLLISGVAILMIMIAGGKFLLAGDNMQGRDQAKTMLSYCVIGLVVVWVAPLMVTYLTSPA